MSMRVQDRFSGLAPWKHAGKYTVPLRDRYIEVDSIFDIEGYIEEMNNYNWKDLIGNISIVYEDDYIKVCYNTDLDSIEVIYSDGYRTNTSIELGIPKGYTNDGYEITEYKQFNLYSKQDCNNIFIFYDRGIVIEDGVVRNEQSRENIRHT